MKKIILILIALQCLFYVNSKAQCVANAGVNDSICGKDYQLHATLGNENNLGYWLVVEKPLPTSNVMFINDQHFASEVVVSDYGTYHFSWTEYDPTDDNCIDVDTVMIVFIEIPHPNAGLDFTACGKFAELNATSTTGSGYWTATGTAWFDASLWPNDTVLCPSCSNNPNVIAKYPSINNTVTFYWYEFNGVCYGYDSVNVFFASIEDAIHLVSSNDTIVCGNMFDRLNAQYPAYGTGYWIDESANSNFYPNSQLANPDSTIIQPNTYGWHYFRWITNNHECRDTSQIVPVLFIEQPKANAGGNYWPGLFGNDSHIKTDTTLSLHYMFNPITSAGTGTWVTLNNSNILSNDFTNPFGTVTFHNETINEPEKFIWIEDNMSCIDKDTLYLWINYSNTISKVSKNTVINVYPNPAQDLLIIENKNIENNSYLLHIYNSAAELVFQDNLINNNYTINISRLAKGAYTIVLYNNTSKILSTFIKE